MSKNNDQVTEQDLAEFGNELRSANKHDLDELRKEIKQDMVEVVGDVTKKLLGAIQHQFEIRDEKIASIEATVGRIDRKLDATIDRVDEHETAIKELK